MWKSAKGEKNIRIYHIFPQLSLKNTIFPNIHYLWLNKRKNLKKSPFKNWDGGGNEFSERGGGKRK